MKCSSCGWPLSPANTNGTCPRCSAPIGSKSSTKAAQAPATWTPAQANQSYEWDMKAAQMEQPQQNEVQYMGWPGMQGRTRGTGGTGETPSPTPLFQAPGQPEQAWFPAQISMHTPAQMAAQPSPMPVMQSFAPSSTPTPAWVSTPAGGSYAGTTARKRRGGQLGFTIAGLCVIMGALLLIFVYIISMQLPQNTASIGNVTPAIVQPTKATHAQPTAATSPTVAPSPTPTMPGQQYISNAQMASEVDKNTAQPIQTATTFTVGKPVYVTFLVHPDGQAGQVCLAWYLNGKFISNYSFPVPNITSTTAYSYTYYHASGSAYVEISWSASANCSNALLAQRVNFTVQN